MRWRIAPIMCVALQRGGGASHRARRPQKLPRARDGSPSGGGFGRLDGAKTQPTTTGSARAQKKEAYLSQLPRLGPRSCASGAAASALEAAVCECQGVS